MPASKPPARGVVPGRRPVLDLDFAAAMELTSIEICTGAGSAALGLERAGFRHLALVENDKACIETLRSVKRWREQVLPLSIKHFYAGGFEVPESLMRFRLQLHAARIEAIR